MPPDYWRTVNQSVSFLGCREIHQNSYIDKRTSPTPFGTIPTKPLPISHQLTEVLNGNRCSYLLTTHVNGQKPSQPVITILPLPYSFSCCFLSDFIVEKSCWKRRESPSFPLLLERQKKTCKKGERRENKLLPVKRKKKGEKLGLNLYLGKQASGHSWRGRRSRMSKRERRRRHARSSSSSSKGSCC